MRRNLQKLHQSVKSKFKEWSLLLFLFDGLLTILISVIVGWLTQMPFVLQIVVGICTLGLVTVGILFWQQARGVATYLEPEDRTSDDERLERAIRRLKEVARTIPTPHSPSAIGQILEVALAPQRSLSGHEIRDWKTESKATLKAMLESEIVKDYEACLRMKQPEIAAKSFLNSLADTLGPSHLKEE